MKLAPLIVGLGGTTRLGSSSEQALRLALAHAQALGCRVQIFSGAQLPTEPFDPTATQRSAAAQALVQALRQADGVIIATPSYHGGLSGLVKNALDFTEDLREDPRPYFSGRAVGCIVCADGAQALGSTLASMRAIVHSLRGWPTPFGVTLSTSTRPFGANGEADAATRKALETVTAEVVGFAWLQHRAG